jgi:SAM-dependent methyltransferase
LAVASKAKDNWSAGKLYEPYVGRWSRLVAKHFLAWLQVGSDADWLDVGCGTGALTEMILRQARPRSVKSVDLSADFIAHAEAQIVDGRADLAVGDAQSLPVESSWYDAVVSGLMLNFVPQPVLAVGEMLRAAKPKGVIAVYLWDYAEKMELMRYFWDAAVALDPAAFDLDEGRRFPLCQPDRLAELFKNAGARDVQVRAIDVPTRFQNFDDYWTPFLGGQGPAPGYAMSLSEERRAALRERVRSKLPVATDGSIDLIARAWAVRGRAAD